MVGAHQGTEDDGGSGNKGPSLQFPPWEQQGDHPDEEGSHGEAHGLLPLSRYIA